MTYFFGKVKLPGSYFEVLNARILLYACLCCSEDPLNTTLLVRELADALELGSHYTTMNKEEGTWFITEEGRL